MTTKFVTCLAATCAISFGALVWAQETPAPQLNQDCVVSVLNRTVQVSDRGTWVLPNVPSTQGQIRARATCVRDGQTVSGQSEYFTVQNNGVADVPNIQFGGLEQIPQSLSFGATATTMSGAGSTRQLVLTAQYADGTSSDVTAASQGPNYSSSNPAIASVTTNGLVTGVSSGNALISARKDGASAMILVSVVTSGDLDSDGLPDDYERANGLNPNDPVDASEDQDGDGLSALQEFQLGTSPLVADTDNDGIEDGEEATAGTDGFVTNPLLADTDGDGLPDGIEIQVGSNPTNSGSADYQAALSSIAVTPGRPVIVYNTIDNESSVKLTVIGTLIDGSTVNLTSKARGTTYISSDLTIANFGLEDGRVFAGVDGVAEIAITNAGHQARSYVTVETFNPAPTAYLALPGTASDIDVDGNYAYIATGTAGLVVVNVSNAAAPVVVGSLSTTNALGVRVKDGKAYVADGTAGIKIIDVSTPTSPTLLGSVDTPGVAQDIAIGEGGRLVVADGAAGLRIVDASNPSAPLLRGAIGADGSFGAISGVDELNGLVGFVSNASLFTALITNPNEPLFLGTMALPNARKLDIVGGYAYVAAVNGGYRVVDVSNPSAPASVGGGAVGFSGYDVVVDRGLAFFADALFPNTVLPWVNVKVPTNPVYQGVLQFNGMPQLDTLGIDLSDNFAYLVGPNSLFIAQLRRILDSNGVAPVVSLIDPPAGTVLFQGRQVTFRASATDDVHVASVSFLINGQTIANIKSPPWDFIYRIPDDATQLNVQVLAVDLAGNLGRSAAIEFLGATIPTVDEQWVGQNLILDRDYFASSVLMQQSNITSANKLTVLGNMVVSGTGASSVTVNTLTVEGDLLINGVQLSVASSNTLRVNGKITLTNGGRLIVGGNGVVSVGNDVSLLNASVISASQATTTPKKVFALTLQVGGTVSIDATSLFDLTGKGYPPNYFSGPDFSADTRSGCYGGVRGELAGTDCTYGRHERARFAGSAGYFYDANNTGYGGGLLDLQASALVLNGTIRANGSNSINNSSRGGGAGGGVHVNVTTLSGAGQFQANGGPTNNNAYPAGAGGRISVYASDRSAFSGSYKANSGAVGAVAGAGTTYVKDASAVRGNLLVDNAARAGTASSTPMRRVGRQLITGVYQSTGGVWRVEVSGAPWKPSDVALDWGIDGLDVDLDASETGSPLYRIVSNTANTLTVNTTDNLIGMVGQYLVGVQSFETVRVTGGADVDFGEDRLVITNVSGSTIGATSTLRVGEVNQATLQIGGGGVLQVRNNPALANLALNNLGTSTLVFDDPVTVNSLTIGSGKVIFNGDVTVGSGLSVGGGAVVTFNGMLRLNGNLTVTGAATVTALGETVFPGNVDVSGNSTLVVSALTVDGNVTLSNTGVLTVPAATANPNVLNALRMQVGGTVSIDVTSLIDLTGKGYPPNYYSGPDFSADTRSGCHGGTRGELSGTDCTYGRFERARFAGSAGYYYDANNSGYGGGLLDLQAGALVLNGTIRVNGANSANNGSRGGGAGGGVNVSVNTLSGSGQFQANGGPSNNNAYPAGAGGRISVLVSDRSAFTGSYKASGGATGAIAGAGTVYVKETSALRGSLLIDNAARVSVAGATPVRRVGRQLITGVYQAAAGVWRIEVSGTPWKPTDATLDWGIDGLDVDLDASETGSPLYRILSNTANTVTINTTDNLIGMVGQYLVGVQSFETVRVTGGADVDFGEDRLVITNLAGSTIGATSTLRVGEVNQGTLQIGGGGVLQLRNNPALANLALNNLGTSTLVFDDPVTVNALNIGSGNVVFNGNVTVGSGLSVSGGATVAFNGALNLNGNLSVTGGATMTVLGETVFPGNVDVFNNSTLVASTFTADGNVTLTGTSKLTVPTATVNPNVVNALRMQVGGTVSIDATSLIDLTGKGYPPNYYSGPDFSADTRSGCHGGTRGELSGTDCTYGRFERARFAGSAGYYYDANNTGYGGGVLDLQANALVLNGTIRANGANSANNSTRGGGAGGGVNVAVNTLSGSGQFQANGGPSNNNAYPAGAGGRVSVYVSDRSAFTGSYRSNSGATGAVAGAGTAYVKDAAAVRGNLFIDNASRVSVAGATPIRRVGRQLITGVYAVSSGTWRIEVSGTPWKPTHAALEWGIDGIDVDLDAGETGSPTYRIVSNGANTVTVNTSDNLAGVVGQYLVGVQSFETVRVTGGADVDFGEDRLVISNLAGSTIGAGSTLRVGEVNQGTLQIGGGGVLRLRNSPALANLSLNNLGTSTLAFDDPVNVNSLTIGSGNVTFNGGLSVAGTLTLQSGAVAIASTVQAANVVVNAATLNAVEVNTSGDLTLTNAATLTVPAATLNPNVVNALRMQVGGTVSIDATSLIDLTGKGYPPNYYSGPDFSADTRSGCHGGVRGELGGTDCTYGRYDRARFAGSAGYYYDANNTGYGGGLLDLQAGALVLNGTIRVNGANSANNSTRGGGAGGGMHVNVTALSGSGQFQANGGPSNNLAYPGGAGGRISVYVSDRSGFTGGFKANGATSGAIAGAGTVYVKDAAAVRGNLLIDNAARVSVAGATPIRRVGRQLITGVYQAAAGVWRIEVSGAPWKPTDATLDWGIDGLDVDLDASETGSPLYRILSNSANTVTINTTDNLIGMVGQYLVGVQSFETVRVSGGADVDFGEDRLVIANVAGSTIGATSTLRVGEVNQGTLQIGGGGLLQVRNTPALANLTLNTLGTSTLVFDDPVNVNTLTVGSGNVAFNGGLTVAGTLSVQSGGIAIANTVQAANVVVNAATLSAAGLNVSGNITLTNAATLTAPVATVNPNVVNALRMQVAGTVSIDATSQIDLTGKGYPPNYYSGPDFSADTRSGCHGGVRGELGSTDCTYGRYERARFAGSAGYYYDVNNTGYGGGLLDLQANSLVLNGTIRANGANSANNSTRGGGGGGGVHVNVTTLSGTGQFQANGGPINSNSYPGGAGGRVSVYVSDRSGFTGSYKASGAASGAVAGAGTVYVKDATQAYGLLIIDNNGRVATANSTPIRHVGAQVITGATRASAGSWVVTVSGTPWAPTNALLDWGIDGISVDLDSSGADGPTYRIVSNTANTITLRSDDDLTAYVGRTLLGVHTFHTLTVTAGASANFFGDRVIQAGNVVADPDDDDDGLTNSQESTHGTNAQNPDSDADGIPDGLEVALATNPLNPASGNISGATVAISATPASVQLELAKVTVPVQLQLVADVAVPGRHYFVNVTDATRFGTTYASSNASVAQPLSNGAFTITGAGASTLTATFAGRQATVPLSVAAAGTVNWTGTQTLTQDTIVQSAILQQATVTGPFRLKTLGDLTINGTNASVINVASLEVGGNLIITGTTLNVGVTGAIQVAGSVTLTNAATLTVPVPTVTPKRVYGLQLVAGGAVSVDATSKIDLNGRGYPADSWSGPDFMQVLYGCHGGNRSNIGSTDCTYGRYERARFAGSAGTAISTGLARGGGLAEIQAQSLVLNGTITANGEKGYHTTGGGAGGGIHVQVATLSGAGSFQVRGENHYGGTYENAGGGRISVYYDTTNTFTGTCATGSNNNGAASGAGTAYVKRTGAAHGQLLVDNNAHVAAASSTPIRRVGRQLITGVYAVSPGVWRIEVGGTPWKPTDTALDWGLDGLDVDLDASETGSPLYRIVSNSTNTVTVNTSDNLSSVVGQYLVGVQTFETVRVTNGADVDFGEDRLVITNLAGSTIGVTSTLRVGEVSQGTLQIGGGGVLQVRNTPALANLTLNILGTGTLLFDDPVSVNTLSIGSGNVTFNGGLTVAGGFPVSGANARVTVNGTLAINGELSVSSGALLTVNGTIQGANNAVINGATLISDDLIINQDLQLLSGATLTVPTATVTPKQVYGLQLVAGGIVTIDATSKIDLNGRGYPADSWSGPDFMQVLNGCHGGNRSTAASSDCTYGRYERARYAGAAGTASGPGTARGGGVAEIHAQSLVLNGTITANGEKGYHLTGGGAGGGIHVQAGSLSGAGSFQVRGENYYSGGYENAGGGRISVYYDTTNTFTGTYGTGSNNNGAASGAGTAYVKRTGAANGQLFVDNNAHLAAASSTPIRRVGRHLITGVYQSSPGVWRIAVGGNPWKLTDAALDWGIDGLDVDLDASETNSPLYRIVSNGSNTVIVNTSDNLAGVVGQYLVGVQTFETVRVTGGADLDLGEDRLVLTNLAGSTIGATSTLRVGEVNQGTLQLGGGGLLQVRNNPALANLTLNGLGTSTLVFDDPVSVNSLTIGSGNVTFNGGLTVPGGLPISGTTAKVTVNGRLVMNGNLSLSTGATLTLNGEMQGAVNATVTGATLVSDDVALSGDLLLSGGGVLTVPVATVTPKQVHELQLVVGGVITIDGTSRIDVNGKGYPANNWAGPDFTQVLYGCHGGNRSTAGSTDCTYGRYERARYAGSAGTEAGSGPARGGGLAEIHAQSLVLNGTITANGEKGYHLTGGGAGGGIHVQVGSLSGAGSFQVRGENYYAGGYENGGGGRISVFYDTSNTFTGSYATGSNNNGAASGAGTAYLKQTAVTYGQLLVDNNNHVAAARSTPMRRVGRQLITGVYQVSSGVWRIAVSGTPWKPSDVALDWGLDGLDVDLNASETNSTHYRIVSNGPNTVTINTTDNLAGVVGQELVGVHTFDRLTVTRGASVDFGDDRVIVLN